MTTQSPFRLDGKVAAVIGASSGIGEAVAVASARAGAQVSLLDLEGGKAEAVAGRLRRE
jgi:NAD(P)-dependent dehydrogenase (short-subunit alcohol dehydrogenase family)